MLVHVAPHARKVHVVEQHLEFTGDPLDGNPVSYPPHQEVAGRRKPLRMTS